MSVISEAERYLLQQIRQGDSQAWRQLVDRYQGRLVAFARGRLPPSAEAEDFVQDTFLGFLRMLSHFREQASLETFLFSILRRKIVDHFRGRAVHVCLLQDVLPARAGSSVGPCDAAEQLCSGEPTASWHARRHEQRDLQEEALTTALRELIDGYKHSLNFRDLQVVEMIFYCQFRNKDVARVAGLDEKRVALIKHRCIKQIQQRVGQISRRQHLEAEPADHHELTFSRIWQQQRLSCLKRSTIGSYLLGTLDNPWRDYVAFHLDTLGCQYCQANLEDLKRQTAADQSQALARRILQSTVGFLPRT